ncbi:3-deoxy-8-phosphooctulonate synthase [Trifolium repens]|nr:3-deoxy-8-phosphooctulonate synthase [Trifolium repens]
MSLEEVRSIRRISAAKTPYPAIFKLIHGVYHWICDLHHVHDDPLNAPVDGPTQWLCLFPLVLFLFYCFGCSSHEVWRKESGLRIWLH